MVVKDSTARQSTTKRSRVRTTLGTVALAAGAAAALTAFAPGTAGADTLVPEPPSPFGSLGSFDPSGGMQTVLGQFGGANVTRLGSVAVVIGGQPTTGSLGLGSLGLGSLDLGSSSGSLGSTSTGSFGSSYGSVLNTPWN
ncbi:hypothetical protein M2284_001193 [Rhodococcus sp. LBL1]|nr:hypothetical protein [Rhodococcus sp. LBL1]MDH6682712.1 hypothetical protein [Rhodococcus sp. LBL2]